MNKRLKSGLTTKSYPVFQVKPDRHQQLVTVP